MRLSPGFDDKLSNYSPRPSIPLETVSLGTLKYSPPKLAVKPQVPPLLHQQPVDTTIFFKQSAQPKASLPTLSQPIIKTVPKQAPPPLKLPPIEDKNIVALKKVIQSVTKPKPTPIKFSPPPIKAPILAKPIPVFNPEPKNELKNLNAKLNEILNIPIVHPTPVHTQPQPATLPIQQVPKFVPEEKPVQKVTVKNEPDIQEIVSKELEKVSPPHPAAQASQQIPVKIPIPESHPEIHPFQKPAHSQQTSPLQIKDVQKSSPPSPLAPTEPLFSQSHIWDLFLIRVNSKLNPYKSVTRGRTILGIKISGLILFALGLFIIISSFFSSFSLNVIFEALSTLTISGILLFLGENLNLFFEPINPYKVHEVV